MKSKMDKEIYRDLAQGKTIRLVCEGNSMLPRVKPGDIKIVTPRFNVRDLRVHDIVFVQIGDKLLTHQIFAIEEDRFTIANQKGQIDAIVTADKILGVVMDVISPSAE